MVGDWSGIGRTAARARNQRRDPLRVGHIWVSAERQQLSQHLPRWRRSEAPWVGRQPVACIRNAGQSAESGQAGRHHCSRWRCIVLILCGAAACGLSLTSSSPVSAATCRSVLWVQIRFQSAAGESDPRPAPAETFSRGCVGLAAASQQRQQCVLTSRCPRRSRCCIRLSVAIAGTSSVLQALRKNVGDSIASTVSPTQYRRHNWGDVRRERAERAGGGRISVARAPSGCPAATETRRGLPCTPRPAAAAVAPPPPPLPPPPCSW